MNTSLKNKLKNNRYLLLGHLTFFVLFIFSFVFANERVLFMDSAYQIFDMINSGGFHQSVRRYSMYLSELLPWLAIRLNLPLKVVIFSYSASFTLIAYGFWLLTAYILKNRQVGIIMLFTFIGMRQTFFHAISETFQLMFFAAFLYAWLNSRFAEKKEVRNKILYYFIAVLMMTLCMFIHPVALFFLVFILGVYILNKNYTIAQKTIITLLTIGIMLLKVLTVESGSHDTDYNMNLREFLGHCLNIFHLPSTEWFLVHLLDFYIFPFLLLTLVLIQYIKKKQYLNFLFFLGFTFCFTLISIIVYHIPDSTIGRERSFLPLMFFCGLPFMRDVFPNISSKWNKVFYIGLSCLLIGGFIKMGVASRPYSQRLKKIEEIVTFANKANQKKLVMDKEISHSIIPFYNWATGLESIMYSAMIDIDSTVNFYIAEDLNDKKNDDNFLNEAVYMAVPWWTFWQINELNPHYFKLPKQPAKELMIENGEFVIKDLRP
jgi:hypothetical protein